MHTRLGFRCLLVLALALLGAGVCSAQRPATRAPTTPTTPAVAPEVLTALEQMGAFLRTLKTFTLHADITTDEVLADTGQKNQFGSTVDYHVRAPDRLQADVTSDRKHRQFFYDGTTLTLYGQRVKFYTSVPAPPTIRETLAMAAQNIRLGGATGPPVLLGHRQSPPGRHHRGHRCRPQFGQWGAL